jgi:hypothetical protein
MMSPVRVQVPPLLFSRYLQEQSSALITTALLKRSIHHNCHHNGYSFEALRERLVEAHGGGDVGVGVGGLLNRGVPELPATYLRGLPRHAEKAGRAPYQAP